MIFVSKSAAYMVTIRPAVSEYHHATGAKLGQRPAIIAFFRQGGCPEWIRDVAIRRFRFSGLGEETDPRSHVSYYDTEEEQRLQGWSDEERDLVEQSLIRNVTEHYCRIEPDPLQEPWPGYTNMKGSKGPGNSLPDKILSVLVSTEQDADAVLAFEREHYQGGRPAVMEALTAHIALRDRSRLQEILAEEHNELVRA